MNSGHEGRLHRPAPYRARPFGLRHRAWRGGSRPDRQYARQPGHRYMGALARGSRRAPLHAAHPRRAVAADAREGRPPRQQPAPAAPAHRGGHDARPPRRRDAGLGRRAYRQLGAPEGHANCCDNFRLALRHAGMPEQPVPAPLNLFMNIPWTADGALSFEPPLSRPGEYVACGRRRRRGGAVRLSAGSRPHQRGRLHADGDPLRGSLPPRRTPVRHSSSLPEPQGDEHLSGSAARGPGCGRGHREILQPERFGEPCGHAASSSDDNLRVAGRQHHRKRRIGLP